MAGFDAHALDLVEFPRVRALLAECVRTSPGRALAEDLQPDLDLETARRVLREADEAHGLVTADDTPPLAGTADTAAAVAGARERGRPLEPDVLADAAGCIGAARGCRSWLRNRAEQAPTLAARADDMPVPEDVEQAIRRAVDPRGDVRDDATPKLAGLRRKIGALESRLKEEAADVARRKDMRVLLQDDRVVLRGGRPCLSVKAESRGNVPGVVHDRSRGGATVFVEPQSLVPLGNELEELRGDERDEITRILWDLTRKCLDVEDDLRRMVRALATLDLTCAKAVFREAFGLRVPEVCDPREAGLDLRGARHPWLMHLLGREKDARGADPADPDAVVPVDVRAGDDFRLLVVTGPNTGGKTVTLKTAGCAAAMVRAGLPVAADRGSRVPVYDHLLVDIGDEQSLEQNLSTFSGHMTRISSILEQAGPGSLVLLDELGAGTDPAEGAALGRAILEALEESGAACLVTTHIGELKEHAWRTTAAENAGVEFDPETLEPTYRLRIGQAGASHALDVARRLGLDPDVLAAAERALRRTGDDADREQVVREMEASRAAAEADRAEQARLADEVRDLREEAADAKRRLEERRSAVELEADAEVDRLLKEALAAADPLIREIQGMGGGAADKAAAIEQVLREALSAAPLGRRRRELIDSLGKHDFVYVPRLEQVCRVLKVDKKRSQLKVRAGPVEAEVPFDDVSWVRPPVPDDAD